MTLKLLYLNIITLFCLTSAWAQQPMSLNECIQLGIENNFQIQIVRNNQQIAANNVTAGNAGLLPVVDLRGQFAGNINNTDQNLRDESRISNRNIHNTTAFSGVSLNWAAFDGFRAITNYKRLEELKQIGELNTRMAIENLVGGISSEYFFYIQQIRLLDNLQYAVDLSKERTRIEEEHFLLGSGSKVALLQAQVYMNADSSRLERQYEVLRASRIRLQELMASSDLGGEFFPADTIIMVNADLMYDQLYNDVFKNNVSLAIASNNITLAEHDRAILRSRSYPYLNLSTGYGFTHNTFQIGTMQNQQTWGMNYGVTLGINLYDGNNRRREQNNALLQIRNSELTMDRIKMELEADLLTIYNGYRNNLRLLRLETQNLDVARENLDIAFERYRLGALSGFELRELQKNLIEAEERLLSIQYQAKIAEISLLQISGRALELL
jgi:outer membrane protein, adhesin transport system